MNNCMNIKNCEDNEKDDGHRGGNVNDDEEENAITKEGPDRDKLISR